MNRKQLAVVHIAKKDLGLDDVTYRELLKSAAGVESARELTHAGFEMVMARFAECGWQGGARRREARIESTAAASMDQGTGKQRWAKDKWRQYGKLEVLLRQQGLTWEYADGIARRMYGVKLVRWCTGEQLRAVTAALVYRNRKREAKGDGMGQ